MKKGNRFSTAFFAEKDELRENGFSESDICYEGYFTKSPPNNQLAVQTSWKKRYFVLAKKNDEFILSYFKNQESRNSSPLGKVPMKKTTELCNRPDYHPKWNTIQKMFKCDSESVIFLKTEERDYFFVGDKESVQSLQGKIANWLQMMTIPQSDKHAQDNFTELEKSKQHLQPKTSSPNKSDPIYATIPELLSVKNDQGKSKEITPEPHDKSASSDIYDIPRIFKRFSQPNQCQINEEMQRSCSLPAELEDYSDIYDTPRNFRKAKLRKEKAVSDDSGIYMSMASIRDSTSTNSSINCSEQINKEDENYINETNNVTEETKLEKLDVTVCRDDIKNNLSFEQVNDKVCVACSDKKCAFNYGDQILAINKLQINDVKEMSMFVNKSMEEQVTVTILRLPEELKFSSEEYNGVVWNNKEN
ncbi:pleckstrin homology domain-containing family S member 1-like [Heterodontus francisci]|uniref:pleckstrin homology domain-containing family S member 1-like n=1 Tax=Heterodontus francisci TaxID=7792 RepID=UPI00355C7B92